MGLVGKKDRFQEKLLKKIPIHKRGGILIAALLLSFLLLIPLLSYSIVYAAIKAGFMDSDGFLKGFFILYGFISVITVWLTAIYINSTESGTGLDILQKTGSLKDQGENFTVSYESRCADKNVETERKMFSDVLELLPAYIILLTPDYHIYYANRFFRQRFGESHGRRCYEYLFNRNTPCEVCETYKVLSENRNVTWEWTGPDNRIYSIFDFMFKAADGSEMIMEMGIDITGLKAAHAELQKLNARLEQAVAERTAELRASTERLQILSETSSKLLQSGNPQLLINELCNKVMKFLDCHVFFNFMIDEKSGRLKLNSCAGISVKEAKNIEWLDLGVSVCGCVARDGRRIIAEYIDETEDARTNLIKSFGIRAYACHPLMSGDKVLGTLSFGTRSRPVFNADEVSMMKTVADEVAIAINRMRYENALRLSGEKLNLALQNGNIGTWEWDLESNRLEWDERMQVLFGFRPGTFDGSYSTFEKCLDEEDVLHVRKAINETINNGAPFELIFRITKAGSKNYISSKASVTRSPDGSPLKLSGVCFDITEMRKGAEKTLFKLNENLMRSNRELEQFAHVASHDLQEPLRMISSYTQMLEYRYNDKLDNDARDYIRYAVEGTVRMQNLINDLLGFSRIETKGGKFEPTDFNKCLNQAIKNLRFCINEKNALVTHSTLPVLVADESQIVILFQNLVVNSTKFCTNIPRVQVSAKEEADHFVFSVKDNGIGIERQYFGKIFGIFQRLVSKEQYEGTGMGLAICKRIVERHEGRIWVESEPGVGSTFFFTIPKNRTGGEIPGVFAS
jgi:signal transduction histidine kinase